MHKAAEPVGDSGGGDKAKDGLIDLVNAKTGSMQIADDIPIEESRKLSRKENDIHDDADGEADDDEERYFRFCVCSLKKLIWKMCLIPWMLFSLNRLGRRGSRSGDSEDDDDDDDDRSDDDIRSDGRIFFSRLNINWFLPFFQWYWIFNHLLMPTICYHSNFFGKMVSFFLFDIIHIRYQ